jgi:diacylglycerol kinase family enzyme
MEKFNHLVVVYSPASSRASEYDKRIAHELYQVAEAHGAELIGISLEKTPYFEAVAMVRDSLRDGDVVIGAGGDGVNQVTLQGALESGRDVVAGFLPLGNANDFATALNGRVKNLEKILSSSTIDFHPLEILVNDKKKFYVAAYATLGITTIAVESLNSKEIRDSRKRLPRLSPMAAIRPRHLEQLSQAIDAMKFPSFRHDGTISHSDSVGFFLTPAAKGVLRPSGETKNFLARDNFFFHSDNVRSKSPGQGWLGKGIRAGRWATLGLPGIVSDYEKLEFLHPFDMLIHVGGDTVKLDMVQTISAERAKQAVKVFAPRKSLQS